jgi:rod shape-determining protein MreC
MYPRKRIPPLVWTLGIVVVVVVFALLIGRLGFLGWILRGLSGLVPSGPATQYTEQEIEDLKAQVGRLQQENAVLNQMIVENSQVEQLNGLDESLPYQLLNAHIIYRDHARLFDTALIDRGSYDGVKVEMPVMDAGGLVGRVVATTSAVSRIVLLTSPNCAFGVIDQRSRDLGIVRGTDPVRWTIGHRETEDGPPPDMLDLEYLSPSAQISVQDILLTSGLSGITPRGLRVGEVVEIIRRQEEGKYEIRVRPFADFDHLENVAVVLYSEQKLDEINELTNGGTESQL